MVGCLVKKSARISCICLLLLVSLAAVPVLAATISCPSSCSCFLPAEAKKLGSPGYCSGKQTVCDYDLLKNEKYCYEKPGTLAAPQLIITAYQVKTTTPATVPVQKCPSGCTCLSAADGKGKGLSSCGGKLVLCGSVSGTPLYCFALPATKPTTITTPSIVVTGLQVFNKTPAAGTEVNRTTPPCGAGCSCLPPDKAGAAGYMRCSGTDIPCDYDVSGRAMYCYAAERVTWVSPVPVMPAVTTAPSESPVVPVNLPVKAVEKAPALSSGPLAAIFSFFASLFGALPANGTPPQSSSLAPVPCNGVMTSVLTDPHNCGGCGVVCSSGSCVAGQCQEGSMHAATACGPLQANCDGTCKYLQSDENNCGSCGNVCPDGYQCCSGLCIPECRFGETCINGWCRNTSSDPSYCGETWERCEGGWPACCNGTCADFFEDEMNCGECGFACGSGETCCRGSETVRALRCANLELDPHNCGRCGNYCGYGDNWTCCNRTCCNGTCCNGTCCDMSVAGMICCPSGCTNRYTDEQNCGRCGDRCQPGAECSSDWRGTACRWHLGLVSLRCNDAQYQHDSVLIMVEDTDRSWEDSFMRTGDTETISTSIGTALVTDPAVVHVSVNNHACGELTIDITDGFDFDEDLTHTFTCNQGIYDGSYTLTYRVYYHEE